MRGAGEGGAVDAALSRRARTAVEAVRGGRDLARPAAPQPQPTAPRPSPAAPQPQPAAPQPGPAAAPRRPSAALLTSLRHHLLAGETHYPDRPGMVELRRRVGAALPGSGYPERGADGVLITAGEGESLFVTLLGLGTPPEIRLSGDGARRHRHLLRWMGVCAVEPGTRDGIGAGPEIHVICDRLFGPAPAAAIHPGAAGPPAPTVSTPAAPSPAASPTPAPTAPTPATPAPPAPIVIGSLDGLSGVHPFRLGFVAAPPEVLSGITKWKQASSICSPAPSQRAALWALGVRP